MLLYRIQGKCTGVLLHEQYRIESTLAHIWNNLGARTTYCRCGERSKVFELLKARCNPEYGKAAIAAKGKTGLDIGQEIKTDNLTHLVLTFPLAGTAGTPSFPFAVKQYGIDDVNTTWFCVAGIGPVCIGAGFTLLLCTC